MPIESIDSVDADERRLHVSIHPAG